MRKLSVNTGGMSRSPKPAVQPKRVQPPAVPDVYRHSNQSIGSNQQYDDDGGFLTANQLGKSVIRPNGDEPDYSSVSNPKSAIYANIGVQNPGTPMSFVAREPLTHKAAVYYHQQLALQEDQGIDLTQSPGRDSPGSSSGSAGSGSRHSTASLDSGRASSYHTQTSTSTRGSVGAGFAANSITVPTQNAGQLSSPRCSVSSLSIGSVDRMSQKSDHETIADWLREFCLEDYAYLFTAAGYDLPTISRMTPEDLTAIGIKKPQHREQIKQQIDMLQLSDTLPINVPGSIDEWLRLLRLDEYAQPLMAQGYQTVMDVTQLAWEDMEDIGIVKLGHQKKILLAIKRVKDILNGKRPGGGSHQIPPIHDDQSFIDDIEYRDMINVITPMCDLNEKWKHLRSLQRPLTGNMLPTYYSRSVSTLTNATYRPFMLKQITEVRGKSLESLDDSNERLLITGSNVSFHRPPVHHLSGTDRQQMAPHQQQYFNAFGSFLNNGNYQQIPWRRSYDDGDITPTNEMMGIGSAYCDQTQQGGGTLPRQTIRTGTIQMAGIRQRPIAKVIGQTIQPIDSVSGGSDPIQYQIGKEVMVGPYPGTDLVDYGLPEAMCYGLHCANQTCNVPSHHPTVNMVAASRQTIGRKSIPPEPPRRKSNGSESTLPASPILGLAQRYSAANQALYGGQGPYYSNYAGQTHHTTVEVHAPNLLDATAHETQSNSSIDSMDTIPFANDNAGTIKQRNRSDMCPGSGPPYRGHLIGSQQSPPPSPTPSLSSSSSLCLSNADETASVLDLQLDGGDSVQTAAAATAKIHSNVLNDIGNMLANLTDELDAMLEEEKRVGLNDSE